MIITRTGAGATTSDDIVFEEKVWTFWEANGTIAVGAPVVHDVSTDTNAFNQNGLLVVEGNSGNTGACHRILGTYQGEIAAKLGASGYSTENVIGVTTDGSTAITTTFVLTGHAAFDGDVIKVLSYGQGYGLSEGGTDINLGDVLTLGAGVGRYEAGTNTTTGMGAQVWALGTYEQATTEAGISIFHRCL